MRSSAQELKSKVSRFGLAGAATVGALLLWPAVSAATPQPVTPPAIPGVAPLPGPVAPAAQTSSSLKLLKATPDTGNVASGFTLAGSGLPASKAVSIVWMTASVTWVLDPRPDSVDYLGRQAAKFGTVLATTQTDANGSFSLELKVPRDFGGIHDVYAVVDGAQVAKGGFLIERTVAITPARGPVGTPITVTYTGLGSSLYEGGGALYYDNKYAGALTANWSRGTATVKIRAAGPVGKHTIVVADAISVNYLNIPQSPVPWAIGGIKTFTVTKDAGPPAASLDWPAAIAPTVDARTTLATTGLAAGAAAAKLDVTSGAIETKVNVTAKGLTPGAPVDLEWSTVVGNRVNCTGTCWTFVSVPLASASAAADGTLSTSIQVPDNLGGWHVVQLLQAGKIQAQVPFFVKRSLVSDPSTLRLKEGQPFTVHLKGVGWTQLDNTVAVDYDNSYIGYGCGFNSNGDVQLNLVATGGPGTHLIDAYPLLYTQQPSYANTPYGMVPILTYMQDAPGLALGYQLPAFRMAIQIVK